MPSVNQLSGNQSFADQPTTNTLIPYTQLYESELDAQSFKDYERIRAADRARGSDNGASDTYDILVMGYPVETRNPIAKVVSEAANALKSDHPDISLQDLQTVIIAADYQEALKFCQEAARPFDKNFVQRLANSWGCCFPTEQGIVVILQAGVIAAAQRPTLGSLVAGTRAIRHELCHAYDVGKRRFWLLRRAKEPKSFHLAYGNCQNLWAEYFANRHSCFVGDEPYTDMLRLCHVLQHLHTVSRFDGAGALCAAMGYALGTLHGMALPLTAVAPQLQRQIQSMGLIQAWNTADTVLRKMLSTGVAWQSQDGILYAADVVRAIEKCCERVCAQ